MENNSGQQFVQRMDEFYRSQINEDKRVVMNSCLVVDAFYMAYIHTKCGNAHVFPLWYNKKYFPHNRVRVTTNYFQLRS